MKVGYISYLNSYPFWHDANKEPIEGIELYKSFPSDLNTQLFNQKIQLSAISAYEYLAHQENYTLLPDICINSSGFVRSVLLYSKKEIHDLNNEVVHLSSQSATSINLLKIILEDMNIKPSETPALSDLTESRNCTALLLIGDQALHFQKEEFPYIYDLAHLWDKMTSLPVVFAVWAIHNAFLNNTKLIGKVHQQLVQTKKKLETSPQDYIEQMYQNIHTLPNDIEGYFKQLNFHFHEQCCESLQLYAEKLHSINLLPKISQLNFFK